MRLSDDELQSRESFTITFEQTDSGDRKLLTSEAVGLFDGSNQLYTLFVRDLFPPESEVPAMKPGNAPVRAAGVPGPGPFRFELPDLEPNRYWVCADVELLSTDDNQTESGVVYAEITVAGSG